MRTIQLNEKLGLSDVCIFINPNKIWQNYRRPSSTQSSKRQKCLSVTACNLAEFFFGTTGSSKQSSHSGCFSAKKFAELDIMAEILLFIFIISAFGSKILGICIPVR
jgi:hypothetical protein